MLIDFFTYFLSSLVVFLGLVMGMFLMIIAPEEQKQGEKYFFALQCVLLGLFAGTVALFYNLNMGFVVVIAVLVFLLMIFYKQQIDNRYLYVLFSIFFFLSSFQKVFFLFIASLLFLYGLPSGSLLTKVKKKQESFLFIVRSYGWFLLLANGLYLLLFLIP